jgi:homoserine kinase
VATPAMGLPTAKARAALPDHLHRRDAIFNMQRVLSLVHALQTGDYERLREGVRDRWHQPARSNMVPLLTEILSLEDPDVLGAFLSGAGPSIAVVARQNFERLEQLLSAMYAGAGHQAVVRTLSVHRAPVHHAAGVEHAGASVSGR